MTTDDEDPTLCDICDSSLEGATVIKDHVPAENRAPGQLCVDCAMGLSSFRRNPDFLRSAIRYLCLSPNLTMIGS